ncbi:MAG: DinB family protein [Chitinophagaceae bacterium]
MNKTGIKNKLLSGHYAFIEYVVQLPDEDFLYNGNNKWSAGQQLEHIYISVKTVRQVLSLPKFLAKSIWGVSNRPGKNYEELIQKYLIKLENGGKSSRRFIPKYVGAAQKTTLKNALLKELNRLCSNFDRFSEEELDCYVLPHPLLGKLTNREMLYFTIYHVEHHEALIRKNLLLK